METCRICYEPGELISVCQCAGSIANVHLDCIQTWISISQRDTCEICKAPFTHQALKFPQTLSQKKMQYFCLITATLGMIHGLTISIEVYYSTSIAWTSALTCVLFNSAQLLCAVLMHAEGVRYWKLHIYFFIGFVLGNIPGLLVSSELIWRLVFPYMYNVMFLVLFIVAEIQASRRLTL